MSERNFQTIQALLAKSGSIQTANVRGLSLDDPSTAKRRKAVGNHLALRPQLQTQHLMQDFETAMQSATAGDISGASLLWKMVTTDPTFRGVFDTRCSGTVSLPRKWRGPQSYIEQLELGHDSIRSVFEEMVNPDQCKLMVSDYLGLGVALGEMVQVPGRAFPTLQRLDPTYIRYRWADSVSNWYYNSAVGPIPILAGDGRWVLWCAAGHAEPWMRGLWCAAGRIYIEKQSAILESMNYQRTLANAAIIGEAPQGATDLDREAQLDALSNWGLNTVISTPPGFKTQLLQGSGEGFQTFDTTIKRCNEELIILVAGQTVSVQGNSGFSSSGIYETIREDLIRSTADSLAYLINTQIIPQWVVGSYGMEELENSPCIEFDTTRPRDPAQLAKSWIETASAVTALDTMLKAYGYELDIKEVITSCSIPVKLTVIEPIEEAASDDEQIKNYADRVKAFHAQLDLEKQGGFEVSQERVDKLALSYGLDKPKLAADNKRVAQLELAPTDVAKVVKVGEARASRNLPNLGDERDDLMISELDKGPEQPTEAT